MNAKKLPSGSWRCQVYSHTEEIPQPDGTIKKKRIYRSFTCDDPSPKGKRRCEKEAAEWAENKENQSCNDSITFGKALEAYITERSSVLSPASIRKYRNMQRNCMKCFEQYRLSDITQDIVQKEINNASAKMSPKSVRDMHGLFVSVMTRFLPNMVFHTAMPKKVHPNIYVPSDEDIQHLVEAVKETDLELPVYLAAFGSLRRGEIAALDASDLSGNILHVSKTMVESTSGKWIVKAPKSYAGDRFVTLPEFVCAKFPKAGKVTALNPTMISQRFGRVRSRIGLKQMRFHDLRHYNASILHALGIPDAYIMKVGGWGNDGVLKSVYRHTMKDMEVKSSNIAVAHFEQIMQHEVSHENEKSL